MICNICGAQDAVFFIEQVGSTFRKKISLCFECAKKYGVSQDPKNLEKSVDSLFKSINFTAEKKDFDENKLCPVCGTSLKMIRSTFRTGCSECYSIFKNDILQIQKSYGITEKYTGSMPRRLSSFKSVLTDRIVLQSKLEESVKNEDYEKAALYRDCLKALEKSPVSGGSDE